VNEFLRKICLEALPRNEARVRRILQLSTNKMVETTKDKIGEIGKVLTENFSLIEARQIDTLFPQFYLKKLIELETLLKDLYGIHGKAIAIGLAASYLIEEITNSPEFEEKVEADKAEKDGE
jgi:hypothetical protein